MLVDELRERRTQYALGRNLRIYGSFVTIASSGHYVAEENPEAFAEAVVAFLQGNRGIYDLM